MARRSRFYCFLEVQYSMINIPEMAIMDKIACI